MSGARLALPAIAGLLLLAGCANLAEGVTESFSPSIQEARTAADRWRLSVGMLGGDPSNQMLYRAAVLAKGAGYSHYSVVDFQTDPMFDRGANLFVMGLNDPAKALPCYVKVPYRGYCGVRSTDAELDRLGTLLGKSPDQVRGEVNGAKNQPITPEE